VLETLLAFAALAVPAKAQPLPHVRAGIAAPTVNMLPLWLAQDAGFFRARGLDVEIIPTDGGSRGLAQVGTGALQEMTVGLSSVLDASGRTGEYRLVASGANTLSMGFFGSKSVKGAAQLRRQKVGVSAFGSESDMAAMLALRKLKLNRRDVFMVESGGTEKRLNLLNLDAIRASALNAPVNFMAERDGLPKLAELADDTPWIFTGIVFSKDYIEKNRETVKNFLRAYVEGIYLGLSDPARSKSILALEFHGLDDAILQKTYDDFKHRVPRDAAPSHEGAETMMRELPRLGTTMRSPNVADYVDFSLIEELKAEGFIEQMKMKYGVQ
jgi:NitT/TauT family transport system substrate-binding protein